MTKGKIFDIIIIEKLKKNIKEIFMLLLILLVICVILILGFLFYHLIQLGKDESEEYTWRYDEEDPIDGYVDYYWLDEDE